MRFRISERPRTKVRFTYTFSTAIERKAVLHKRIANAIPQRKTPGRTSRSHIHTISGDNGERAPPVPIPNTEVKPLSADGTWLETARESRSPPDSNKKAVAKCNSFRFFLMLFDKPYKTTQHSNPKYSPAEKPKV